jgi:hypothetical protein
MPESDERWPTGARHRQQLRRGRPPTPVPHEATIAPHTTRKEGKQRIRLETN